MLIRLTNLVPIGIIMFDFYPEMTIEIQRLRNETGEPSPEFSAYEFLTQKIYYLPKEFLEFVEKEACRRAFPLSKPKSYRDERNFRMEFIRQYVEYSNMRASMLSLVLRIENERKVMRSAEKARGLKENSITPKTFTFYNWDAFPLTIKTTLLRDKYGNLQTTGLAALIGTFDDNRLRKCEICDLIFWAKREDSKTCSKKCANTFRVRRYRSLTDEEKAERKAKRKANREHKQKLKKMRENKNGNL